MMWQEFEQIAGYEVSYEDYTNYIEPMYMATEVSKQDFVKMIDRKRFALRTEKQLKAAMRKEAKHLMETAEHYTDFESKDRLDNLISEYTHRFWNGLQWFIHSETTGDRFWNAPGRGCSFPAELVIITSKGEERGRIKLA